MYNTTNRKIDFCALVTVYGKDNHEYLEQALNSIIDQTLIPSEVIVVEDGPLNKDLYLIIDKFKQNYNELIKIVKLEKNIGTGLAINEGLKNCSFDFVAKIDSDDISIPTRFETQINTFINNPLLSFVSATVAEFKDNKPEQIIAFRRVPEKHEDIVKYAKKRCPVNHPVVMYKKSSVLACGGYNNFTFGEDYDLWVRAIVKGYKFYNIHTPLLYFRTNENTIKKRGGLWYLRIDIMHHYSFYKIGFLSIMELSYNIFIRIIVRLLPFKLRSLIYSKILRSKQK